MKSFLLIDDHVVVRSGIKSMLSEMFKPVEIYEAETGKKALQVLKEKTDRNNNPGCTYPRN
ncbi:MAG: hypothetical protein V9E88_15670 [Ferruginibacter sp.]